MKKLFIILSGRYSTTELIGFLFLITYIMEYIRITSGCDGHLIGVFDNYTIEDHKTKHGIKCKLYEIPTGNNSFAGYNDFHYGIELVFKCDGCGEYKPIKERFEVYDENYNLQKGIYECVKCKGL